MIDHVLVIGFGGPPRPEDVPPFLEHVTRGLSIPAARLVEVAHHYAVTGGASPYNEHAFRLFDQLRAQLRETGITLPCFIGMRNWHPFLNDTIGEIHQRRLHSGLGIVLAPHRSYSSFDQYRQNVEDAKAEVGAQAIRYDYLQPWHNHPFFIEAQADEVRKAMGTGGSKERAATHLVFSAHSIPMEMAERCRYEEEFRTSSRLVAERLNHPSWSLAYQSRSGNPKQPWLEPDVLSVLRQLQGEGARDVLLVPIGFLSDHTEVLYDLDIEACQEAERLGLRYRRASTVMDHPAFVRMFAQLIEENLLRKFSHSAKTLP